MVTDAFDNMSKLLGSIKQIDTLLKNQTSETLIEDALIATKEINLDHFDGETKTAIVESFRRGLLLMYENQQTAVNKEIGLGITYSEIKPEIPEEGSADKDILKDLIQKDRYQAKVRTTGEMED